MGGTGGSPVGGTSPNADAGADGVSGSFNEFPSVHVDVDARHQTLVGFGASVAWYGEWLITHPNSSHLYDLLFRELGIDILRLRNRYRGSPDFDPTATELVTRAATSLNRPPTILMSSWSPPASMKANGKTDCAGEKTCTLSRDARGYVYEAFAGYWYDSLQAYAEIGVVPEYISIQNEPDFTPDGWEGCRFAPTETDEYPSYVEALKRVHQRLDAAQKPPKVLGPEVIGVHSARVQKFAATMDPDLIDGVAHHLYGGTAWNFPDDYIPLFQGVRALYVDKPIFQTEFSVTQAVGAFETAWLIHNALTEENAVAYLYWDLIWAAGSGLVELENPAQMDTWKSANGYAIRDPYYSLKHYAAFTDPGYIRVGAVSELTEIRSSAFISPDATQLTVVLLNVGTNSQVIHLDFGRLRRESSAVYRTSEVERFADLGALPTEANLSLSARSIASVVLRLTP